MKVLAVETATPVCSVAIVDSVRGVMAERTEVADRKHSERLLPLIDILLDQSGVSLSDIDCFAASRGPGSFTGVRIGLGTMKAFANARQKRVIGVSSLRAMSYAARSHRGFICPTLDAGRGELYAAVFSYEEGKVKRWIKEMLIKPSALRELLKYLQEKANMPVQVKMIGNSTEDVVISAAHVGMTAITSGESPHPLYVRLPQAQVNLRKESTSSFI